MKTIKQADAGFKQALQLVRGVALLVIGVLVILTCVTPVVHIRPDAFDYVDFFYLLFLVVGAVSSIEAVGDFANRGRWLNENSIHQLLASVAFAASLVWLFLYYVEQGLASLTF